MINYDIFYKMDYDNSEQLCWLNIFNTLNDVKERFKNNKSLDETTISELNNSITLVHNCANLYGILILDNTNTTYNNYKNSERLFYNQLKILLKDFDIYMYLQNKVRIDAILGTRYFDYFLDALSI